MEKDECDEHDDKLLEINCCTVIRMEQEEEGNSEKEE